MFSPETKRNFSRVVPVALIWLLFSIVYTLLEKGLLGRLTGYPSTGNPYNFSRNIFVTPVSALLTGIIIGTMEIKYFYGLFIRMSFTKKIVLKSITYLAIIIAFLLMVTAVSNSLELHRNIFDSSVWANVRIFLSTYAFWSVVVYIAAIIVVSQFYTEVSENLGQGVLANFFKGKYHNPKEEERIFMFLDMKSSTTIAERLGHVTYFELLREYYADLSKPVIKYAGEIYQYVGDEIIVSWKLRNGITHSNCIQCFYSLKDTIKKQGHKYVEKFGVMPEFKAAIHIGMVTTGEIGTIKKDIIFTGDVLNTTARIQGLCNHYKVDLLLSAELTGRLSLPAGYQLIALGESELRGRDEKINLFTLLPSKNEVS